QCIYHSRGRDHAAGREVPPNSCGRTVIASARSGKLPACPLRVAGKLAACRYERMQHALTFGNRLAAQPRQAFTAQGNDLAADLQFEEVVERLIAADVDDGAGDQPQGLPAP